MGEHLIDGEFQSDKYPWCQRGFVPLKLTDPQAQPVLWLYANMREFVDQEFADDLREGLRLQGYEPSKKDKEYWRLLLSIQALAGVPQTEGG